MKFAGYFDGNRLFAIEGVIESCDDYQFLGDVWLFRRDELTDKLGIRHAVHQHYSDTRLILLAFKKWGTASFNHFNGAWAFALFDINKKTLYLARTIDENASLFYYQKNTRLYFSNGTSNIQAAMKATLEIDPFEFAALSVRLMGNTGGKTIIKDLLHVLPGFFIKVNGQMNKYQSTFVQRSKRKLLYKNEHDYFLAFQSLVANAVLQRCRQIKKAGVFLSSGLDSTTVFSFLADALHHDQQLKSYTSVPAFMDEKDCPVTISEEPLVRQLLAAYSRVDARFMSFDDISFSELFKGRPLKSLFYPVVHSNSFWIEGILKQARLDGVDAMFTGQMGNYSISFRGIKKPNLFSVGNLINLLKKVCANKYFFKRDHFPFSVLHDQVLDKLFKADCLEKNVVFGYSRSRFNASFRKQAFEKLHVFASTDWSILSQEHGIRIFDPTADQELVSFLDTVPPKLFSRKGIEKYLLKKSMAGRLPISILSNIHPKPQTADLGRRLQKEHFLTEKVEFLIDRFRHSAFFDVKKLEAVHSELLGTKRRGRQHVLGFHLLYMISLMEWYDRFEGRANGGSQMDLEGACHMGA